MDTTQIEVASSKLTCQQILSRDHRIFSFVFFNPFWRCPSICNFSDDTRASWKCGKLSHYMNTLQGTKGKGTSSLRFRGYGLVPCRWCMDLFLWRICRPWFLAKCHCFRNHMLDSDTWSRNKIAESQESELLFDSGFQIHSGLHRIQW